MTNKNLYHFKDQIINSDTILNTNHILVSKKKIINATYFYYIYSNNIYPCIIRLNNVTPLLCDNNNMILLNIQSCFDFWSTFEKYIFGQIQVDRQVDYTIMVEKSIDFEIYYNQSYDWIILINNINYENCCYTVEMKTLQILKK